MPVPARDSALLVDATEAQWAPGRHRMDGPRLSTPWRNKIDGPDSGPIVPFRDDVCDVLRVGQRQHGRWHESVQGRDVR